jgi:hypothetical protein
MLYRVCRGSIASPAIVPVHILLLSSIPKSAVKSITLPEDSRLPASTYQTYSLHMCVSNAASYTSRARYTVRCCMDWPVCAPSLETNTYGPKKRQWILVVLWVCGAQDEQFKWFISKVFEVRWPADLFKYVSKSRTSVGMRFSIHCTSHEPLSFTTFIFGGSWEGCGSSTSM